MADVRGSVHADAALEPVEEVAERTAPKGHPFAEGRR